MGCSRPSWTLYSDDLSLNKGPPTGLSHGPVKMCHTFFASLPQPRPNLSLFTPSSASPYQFSTFLKLHSRRPFLEWNPIYPQPTRADSQSWSGTQCTQTHWQHGLSVAVVQVASSCPSITLPVPICL
ncbi:unnamed protein product [Protopolystoma xenopodis]|uniref:Uncharacterized protein n=1 Tax=Protopolystoma xenopodis TaxID=117903 RepID=A0A3S5FC07_9PLAT|nr:unnamed protein product [Protopolystoma xenopodis]